MIADRRDQYEGVLFTTNIEATGIVCEISKLLVTRNFLYYLQIEEVR